MANPHRICPYCHEFIDNEFFPLHAIRCSLRYLRPLAPLAPVETPDVASNSPRYYYRYDDNDDIPNALDGPLLSSLVERFMSVLANADLPVRRQSVNSSNQPFFWMHVQQFEYDDYEYNSMVSDTLGNVEVGFSDEQIDEISELVNAEDVTLEDKCPVCLEYFSEVSSELRKLKCGHVYCDDCIKQWLYKHKRCPFCQVDLEDVFLGEKIEINDNVGQEHV